MFSSTSSRATHLFLSCVVTRALILFFFCLQRKMPRTPPLKFAPTRGEDKPPPDRTRSDSRPAGKCFKVRTHACREVAHLSCEQGPPPPPFYCKAQVQHTSSFGSLVEQNECKINTAGIRTASDLYTKILTDPKRFEVAFLFIKKNVKRSWWTIPKVIGEHAHLCLPHILGKPWCCHMWAQSACSALYILGRANKVNGQTFKTLAAPKRSRVLS